MTKDEIKAVKDLLLAVEHIQLPMLLSQEQASTYNELMLAVAEVEIALEDSDA